MKRYANICKTITILIMFFTAILMVYDKVKMPEALPDYFEISVYDTYIWVSILIAAAVAQIVLLLQSDCNSCRVFGDLLLQFSGLILLIIGWAFIAKYPPLSILMVVYPTWGISMIIGGRVFGKRSRYKHANEVL